MKILKMNLNSWTKLIVRIREMLRRRDVSEGNKKKFETIFELFYLYFNNENAENESRLTNIGILIIFFSFSFFKIFSISYKQQQHN